MAPKRRLGVDTANILDGDTRGKRRKDTDTPYPLDSSSPAADAEVTVEPEHPQDAARLEPAQVRDHGLQIWNAVRDTRGKEDQDLSYDFMRLPSKRQYPDYYIFIKQPVCLEDIKAKLDGLQYINLESVRQDLDLCFKNARKYNIKDSGIYKAAKSLQKVVAAEYSKLTGSEEDEIDVVGDEGSGEEGEKRRKKQSLSRTLKNKLNKLCEKTDDSGRILSSPFMEPPDRKLYADYYKIIKKVMCFEMIFKKLKRKEYQDIIPFTADVELIFSNAMEYNVEHSVIWEDARVLRDHFRKLMATLPPEYANIAGGSLNQLGKIKLKLPGTVPKQDGQNASEGLHASPSLTLKLPGSSARQVTQSQPAAPSANPAKKIPPALTVPTPESATSPAPASKPLLTAHPAMPATTSMTSRGAFPAKAASPSPSLAAPPAQHVTKQSTPQPQSYTPSPAPPEIPMKHPIQSLLLQTTPYGRTFHLDREEGVRMWSVRLGMSEKGIRVTDLHFVEDEEGSDSGEDEGEEESEGEGPAKGHRRGPKGKTGAKGSENQRDKAGGGGKKEVLPDASVKLNGSALRPTQSLQPMRLPDSKPPKQWQSELSLGCSTLEVRAGDAGEMWKIVLDRQSV